MSFYYNESILVLYIIVRRLMQVNVYINAPFLITTCMLYILITALLI